MFKLSSCARKFTPLIHLGLHVIISLILLQSAIMAYDKILNKDYAPIPIRPGDYKKQEEKDPIITVRVDKEDNEPLVS